MTTLNMIKGLVSMKCKIFVRNLSFSCVESQLGDLFRQFGDVISSKIPTDRDTGRSRGFGFVEMSSQREAEQAIRGLHSTEFGGRVLHVAMAEGRDHSDRLAEDRSCN